jgi:ribonucleoside-diphosphate reductase alpha chain
MFKTEVAREIWEKEYRFGTEEPIDTFKRVAKALADVEPIGKDYWEEKFLNLLVRFNKDKIPEGLRFTPGGRITANAGTSFKKATMINCFVSGPITSADIKYTRKSDEGDVSYDVKYKTDENPDDLMNIFLTIVEQAKTLASEGGYGLNFGFIRPRGSLIKGTGIKHPGVVSYMRIWDSVSECIVKGSDDGYVDLLKNYMNDDKAFGELKDTLKKKVRKGAMMGALPCHHPDIEEFVKAKQVKGVLTKFNISVLIDDAFMSAVEKDELYDLHFNGVVYKKIKAKELYDLIMESCYNRGEPGVLFFDNMQRNNPISYLGKVNCSNPCLHGDSLLLTKEGLAPIKNLEGKKATIWNGETWVTSDIFSSGIKPVYEMTLSNGIKLKGTLDHRVDVEGLETEIGRTLGKQVTRITGSPWDGIEYSLSDTDMICLGFAFGDAHYHIASGRYKYVYIGDKDSEIEPLFNSVGEELEEEHRYDKRILSFTFSEKCDRLNFPKVPLPERYLSDEILKMSYRQMLLFLKGLYSANGSVMAKHNRIALKTSCKTLSEQLQTILMVLGIKSYITTNKAHNVTFSNGDYMCKESYDLNVTSSDTITFKNLINFVQEYKNKELEDMTLYGKFSTRRIHPKVRSIDYIGEEKVYDFTEPETHWAFVNGLKVHNCGEVTGLPTLTTVCLLGSFNLTQYVDIKNGVAVFDLERYTEDIKTATRMLDNVNDISYGVLPPYEWAIKNLRQIGMGINGLGSALAMLKIPYNSLKAVEFVKTLCEIKENITWQTSALLAKEKGVFTAYNKKSFENTEYFKSDRLWEETKNLLRKHGARNAKTTTNPPLGNGSLVCDSVSNGIEPIYRLDTERTVICTTWPEGLDTSNVKRLLTEKKKKDYSFWQGIYRGRKYYYEEHNRGLCEVKVIRDYGYQWLLDNFPNEDHTPYLITTKQLDVDDHIGVQAMAQYYCNQSISKTINVPKSYPFSKFKEMYIKGWKKGLIGVTAYRDESMEAVLSDISKAESSKEIMKRDIKLPDTFINGDTRIIKKEGKKFYITFSYLPSDNDKSFPICMWIQTNAAYKEKDDLKLCNKAARELAKLAYRSGIDEKIITEAIEKTKEDYPHNRLGRMISLNLRHNVPRERILMAITDLEGDGFSTLLFSVRKFLAETIPSGTVLPGYKCLACGSTNVMIEAGCKKCKDCLSQSCG